MNSDPAGANAPGHPALWRLVTGNLLVAVAYFAGARFGALLAIPPGYASAFWVPAGIAFMAVLTGGPRYGVGVLAGSMLNNLLISSGPAAGSLHLALSLGIGLGAVAQAVVGAALVRRQVGYPTALVRIRETLLFLALAGPVACLVNSSLATALLYARGVIPPGATAFSWFNWWVGDSLGVLLVIPVWMVAAGEPRELWRRRWRTVALPVIGVTLAALAVFVVVQRLENAGIRVRFESRSRDIAEDVQSEIDSDLALLVVMRGHFDGSAATSARDFEILTGEAVARSGSLLAVEWAPRVLASERAAFERRAAAELARPYTIHEGLRSGVPLAAGPRAEYLPIYYVEPRATNEAALGFDFRSEPLRRAAVESALRQNAPATSAPIVPVQSPAGELSALVFLPAFPRGRDASRTTEPLGFVVGVLSAKRLVESALAGTDLRDLSVRLIDTAPETGAIVLYDRPLPGDDRAAPATDLHAAVAVQVPGRTWHLEFQPSLSFLDRARTPLPWIVQSTGLLFAALLGLLLLNLSGRHEEVIREVADRTAALRREIEERERAERALRDSEQRYRTVIDQAPLKIALLRDERYIYANPRTLASLGMKSLEEIIGKHALETMSPAAREAGGAERSARRQQGLPTPRSHVTRLLRTDGTDFPAQIYSGVIELADGPAVLLFGFDLTEQRRLEAEIAAKTRRLELSLRNATDGVHILDLHGRVVEASDSFCTLIGYAREEVAGLHVSTWDTGAEAAAVTPTTGRRRIVTHYRRRGGGEMEVEVHLDLFESGGEQYFYCSARDMTELRRLERALVEVTNREQRRVGRDLHEQIAQVLAGISMLAAVESRAEQAAGRPSGALAKIEALAREAVTACRAAAHGLSPLVYHRNDLAGALRELVRLLSTGDGPELNVEVRGSAAVRLANDTKEHLYRIAEEALANARQHAGATRVDLVLTVDPSEVRLEVVDDGTGLPRQPEDIAGTGISMMRLRASIAGAVLEVGPNVPSGTRVICVCRQLAPVA
ncbi:MAG: CHASE domain-containing protein [Proteobacteria bacterium]|nr:CHASE domain-containing protein [Pseudomonadota bacterium]